MKHLAILAVLLGSFVTTVAGTACGDDDSSGNIVDGGVDGGGGADGAVVVDGGGADGSIATWKPKSKGLWIWYFSYTGLTPAQAATRAQAQGIGYVLIKSGQDASFWSDRYNADIVAEFTSRGMKVFAWPYITPSHIAASIDAVAKAARVPGTSGVVLDVEIEWEGGTHSAAATTLCDGIRLAAPGVWLGYTSFGWVGYHTSLPFHEFDTHCGDAFFPQVYWSDRGTTWQHGYTQAMEMIATLGLTAPVWMIQSNDDTPSGNAPSTADLNAFFDTANSFTSLWELPAANETTKHTQLGALHWANPQ